MIDKLEKLQGPPRRAPQTVETLRKENAGLKADNKAQHAELNQLRQEVQ